jgi:hypothetical protein
MSLFNHHLLPLFLFAGMIHRHLNERVRKRWKNKQPIIHFYINGKHLFCQIQHFILWCIYHCRTNLCSIWSQFVGFWIRIRLTLFLDCLKPPLQDQRLPIIPKKCFPPVLHSTHKCCFCWLIQTQIRRFSPKLNTWRVSQQQNGVRG